MKINNQHLEALRQLEGQTKTGAAGKSPVADEFAKALAQELGSVKPEGMEPSVLQQAGLGELAASLGITLPQGPTGIDEDAARALTQLSGLLDGLDAYAQVLGSGNEETLKSAFAALEELSGSMSELKSFLPTVADKYPGMNEIFNELEVLAYTEQFKFNRGDYL